MAENNTSENVRLDARTLRSAITNQYPLPDDTLPEIKLADLITALAEGRMADMKELNLVEYLNEARPGTRLSRIHFGMLALIETTYKTVIKHNALSEEVTPLLNHGVFAISLLMVEEGLLALSRQHEVLRIMDQLVAYSVGVADLRGRARQDVLDHIRMTLNGLFMITDPRLSGKHGKATLHHLLGLLADGMARNNLVEQERVEKLEQRLIDTETGRLKAGRSRNLSAAMLNQNLAGKELPESIHQFLRGVWFDSLQLILTRQGMDSDNFKTASKLTETLVWSVQKEQLPGFVKPEDAFDAAVENFADDVTDRIQESENDVRSGPGYYDIVEGLPAEIAPLLVALEYQNEKLEAQMAELEQIYIDLMSGDLPDYVEWIPLTAPDDPFGSAANVSKTLLKVLDAVEVGHWFVHRVEDELPRQIKLVQKLPEMQYLLFTNRLGQKVLQTTFKEFAYHIASGAVNSMVLEEPISNAIRSRLSTMVSVQRNKDKADRQRKEERQQVNKLESFEAANLIEATPGSKTQKGISAIQAEKAIQTVQLGTWFSLVHPELGSIQAKVAVKFPQNDRVILVDRTGLNLGEYTNEQICMLMTTGRCLLLGNEAASGDKLVETVTRVRTSSLDIEG